MRKKLKPDDALFVVYVFVYINTLTILYTFVFCFLFRVLCFMFCVCMLSNVNAYISYHIISDNTYDYCVSLDF